MDDSRPKALPLDAHSADYDSLVPPLRLDRRGFLATSVAAGFAVAAGPVAADTATKPRADGLTVGAVRVPGEGGEVPAYRPVPAGATDAPVCRAVQEVRRGRAS